MKRYDCIQALVPKLSEDTIVVSTLGNTADMLQKLRLSEANLYPMNLGCCTAVAMGLALALPHRRVVALDGDGNLLLNLSVLADLANLAPPNLAIIVFDNESYESGGGLPTATAGKVDLAAIAKAAGVNHANTARTSKDFEQAADKLINASETAFLVAKVEKDGQPFLPPMAYNYQENKFRFARYIEKTESVKLIAHTLGSKLVIK